MRAIHAQIASKPGLEPGFFMPQTTPIPSSLMEQSPLQALDQELQNHPQRRAIERSIVSLLEIAKEFEGKIKVFKLNTDENPNVASQYGIRSIPTLMVFKDGQKVDTVVGAVPKTTLSGTIAKYL